MHETNQRSLYVSVLCDDKITKIKFEVLVQKIGNVIVIGNNSPSGADLVITDDRLNPFLKDAPNAHVEEIGMTLSQKVPQNEQYLTELLRRLSRRKPLVPAA